MEVVGRKCVVVCIYSLYSTWVVMCGEGAGQALVWRALLHYLGQVGQVVTAACRSLSVSLHGVVMT